MAKLIPEDREDGVPKQPALIANGWYADDLVFVVDGKAFGITKTLKTICLGSGTEVMEYLKGGAIPKDIVDVAQETLEGIKMEVQNGRRQAEFKPVRASRVKRVRNQRGKLTAGTKHRTKRFKKLAVNKRLPSYTTKPN